MGGENAVPNLTCVDLEIIVSIHFDFRALVHQRDDFAHKMVTATLQLYNASTENEKTCVLNTNMTAGNSFLPSISGTTITPEGNHIALEVSELKAQIRKLKQQL